MKLLVAPSIIYHVLCKFGNKGYNRMDGVEFNYRPADTILSSLLIGDSIFFRLGEVFVFIPVSAIIGMYELLEMAADHPDERTKRNRDMWIRNQKGESLEEIASDFGVQPSTVRTRIESYKRTWQYHVKCSRGGTNDLA